MNVNAFIRDQRLGLVWLAVRLWVGWQFLHAGWEKTFGSESSSWWGSTSGVHGFLSFAGSSQQTSGDHPAVGHWYAAVINHGFLHVDRFFAIAIPLGELLVGVGLILGLFTLTAAFFGVLLNLNFLLSGSTSAGVNPLMLGFGLLLMTAGTAAYTYGVDRVLMPRLKEAVRGIQRPTFHRPLPLPH